MSNAKNAKRPITIIATISQIPPRAHGRPARRVARPRPSATNTNTSADDSKDQEPIEDDRTSRIWACSSAV